MIAVVFLSLLSAALGAEICCQDVGCFQDVYPFGHLPLPQCTVQANFNLYTRANWNTAQMITRTTIPPNFANGRRTIFLVHGWNGNRDSQWLHDAKEALLNRGDYNVIVTGWGGGANEAYYPQSASNTRVTGAEIGLVAQFLVSRGLNRNLLYCVGHSLGGHTCGHAGKTYKFQRIIGLDPAGPEFENYPNEAGLNSNDANFVDVLHTHGKGSLVNYGTNKRLGHADFYPNGGGMQPGCITKEAEDELIDPEGKGDFVSCSHARAPHYFVESVYNSCFHARQVCTDNWNTPGSCSSCSGVCHTMGWGADVYGSSGIFYLEVNSNAPYCQH